MKKLSLLIAVLSIAGAAYAQPYTFSVQSGTYTELTNATSLNKGLTWDDPQFDFPVGFNFKIGTRTMDQMAISEYGLGGFLSEAGMLGQYYPFLVPMSLDLIDRGSDTINFDGQPNSLSPISHQISGTPGSRICKIEWKNAGFYNEMYQDNVSTDFMNFQIWLYEGTSNFEVRFGNSLVTDPTNVFEGSTGPFVGVFPEINDATFDLNVPGQTLEGLALTPTIKTITTFNDITYITGMPTNGAIYKFTNTSIGISKVQEQLNKLSLSPNPATNFINLNYPLDEALKSIQLLTINGQLLNQIPVGNQQLEITDLAPGVYFLTFETVSGATASKKFVKN